MIFRTLEITPIKRLSATQHINITHYFIATYSNKQQYYKQIQALKKMRIQAQKKHNWEQFFSKN